MTRRSLSSRPARAATQRAALRAALCSALGSTTLAALASLLLATPFSVMPCAARESAGAAVTCSPARRPPACVPLNHWSYPLLERLAARGVISLDLSTRPVPRSAVAEAVAEAVVKAAVGAVVDAVAGGDSPDAGRSSRGGAGVALTEREEWALDRLAAEFLRGEVDSPALSLSEGDAFFGAGVRAFTQARYGGEDAVLELWPGTAPGGITPLREASRDVGVDEGGEPELDAASDVDFELWGGVGDALGFYADSQLLLGGQEGARQVRLSSRVRTWRGISFTSERAYLRYEHPHFSVTLGRRGSTWGRSRWGKLMLSGAAPTFDQAEVRAHLGPFSFQTMHAFLEYADPWFETERTGARPLGDGESLFLAAHRLVVSGDWGSVGAGETVVYSSVLPDPAYLNPLVPYYLSQHNERADDNVLWSADFEYRVLPGLTAYGEFLVDDLQYERSTDNPDKYGITVGCAWYGSLAAMDAEWTTEYTNVRKWTYTHDVAEHRFEHDGLPLGFSFGPDADLVTSELVVHPAPRWSVALTLGRARSGEGSILVPFDDDEDHEPTFPSGVVETASRVALELGYQSLERVSMGLGAAFESTTNVGHADGSDDDGWEFWGGVQFRI